MYVGLMDLSDLEAGGTKEKCVDPTWFRIWVLTLLLLNLPGLQIHLPLKTLLFILTGLL